MKLTTYNSLLTGKRTHVIAYIGKCGHNGYREAMISIFNGTLRYAVTDGYSVLMDMKCPTGTTLKQLLQGMPQLLEATK